MASTLVPSIEFSRISVDVKNVPRSRCRLDDSLVLCGGRAGHRRG